MEFHEARIYEETLNTLLYEEGEAPNLLVDQLQMASARQRRANERDAELTNSEDEGGSTVGRRRVHHTPSNDS